jgi:hypothetical protein
VNPFGKPEWGFYSNSTSMYRAWKLIAPCPAIRGKRGDWLFQDKAGFQLRDHDRDLKSVRYVDAYNVKGLVDAAIFQRGVRQFNRAMKWLERSCEIAAVLAATDEDLRKKWIASCTVYLYDKAEKTPARYRIPRKNLAAAVERELTGLTNETDRPEEPRVIDLRVQGVVGRDVTKRAEAGRRAIERRIGKKCVDCGTYFPWPGNAQTRCESCREALSAENEAKKRAKRKCVDCGAEYKPRGRAKDCVECRDRRKGAQDSAGTKNGDAGAPEAGPKRGRKPRGGR